MSDQLRKPKRKTKPPLSVKCEPEQLPVSLSKPSRASTMVVCGKPSTIKAISENNAKRRKVDKKEREVEGNPKANEKKFDNLFVEEKGKEKKRSQERSVSGRRNSRSNNKKSGEVKHQYGGNELSSHDALEVTMDNKKENAAKMKQGAASFLKRMKQNSPVEDDSEKDAEEGADDDLDEEESKDSKMEEEEEKRRSVRKKDVKSERVTRSSRGSGRVKRGVGRPPKRSAATSPRETTGKRGRDNGESEFSRSRKRTRR